LVNVDLCFSLRHRLNVAVNTHWELEFHLLGRVQPLPSSWFYITGAQPNNIYPF